MAFVDDEIICGVADLLFAVVRDFAYMAIDLGSGDAVALKTTDGITNAVFAQLRNARILQVSAEPNLVVCWEVTRSHAMNTCTPSKWAMRLVCVAWTFVQGVVQVR